MYSISIIIIHHHSFLYPDFYFGLRSTLIHWLERYAPTVHQNSLCLCELTYPLFLAYSFENQYVIGRGKRKHSNTFLRGAFSSPFILNNILLFSQVIHYLSKVKNPPSLTVAGVLVYYTKPLPSDLLYGKNIPTIRFVTRNHQLGKASGEPNYKAKSLLRWYCAGV